MAKKGLPKKYIKKYGISKKAWREYRKTKRGRGKPKTKRTRRKGGRKMGRRSKTIPLAPVLGLAYGTFGGPFPPYETMLTGDWQATMLRYIERYIGINKFGQFEVEKLTYGLVPVVAGLLIHKFIGGYLGLNRMLGRAKVPLIRL